MIAVIATLRVKDGKGPELEAVFADLAAKVRANEPGNSLYQLTKSRTDPNIYKVMELYRDVAAQDAHRGSEHFKAGGPLLGACLDGRPDIEYLDTVG